VVTDSILAKFDSFPFQFNPIQFSDCIGDIIGRFKINDPAVREVHLFNIPSSLAVYVGVGNFSGCTNEILKILWPKLW
jgi:hypothetical protein